MLLERKEWDSEFFSKEIYELKLDGYAEPLEIKNKIEDVCESAFGIECHVDSRNVGMISNIEEVGFRFVDSKVSFLTKMNIEDIPDNNISLGIFRKADQNDMDRVEELTVSCLVDNDFFISRYKNYELYSKSESEKYYMAWNKKVLSEFPDLFLVWEVKGVVVGFFNYMISSVKDGMNVYKGILTAVDPQYRGYSAQNEMQYELYRSFGLSEWYIQSATQLSNIAVLRNHIKAGKDLINIDMIFFKKFK